MKLGLRPVGHRPKFVKGTRTAGQSRRLTSGGEAVNQVEVLNRKGSCLAHTPTLLLCAYAYLYGSAINRLSHIVQHLTNAFAQGKSDSCDSIVVLICTTLKQEITGVHCLPLRW